jgi:hypothetical protein
MSLCSHQAGAAGRVCGAGGVAALRLGRLQGGARRRTRRKSTMHTPSSQPRHTTVGVAASWLGTISHLMLWRGVAAPSKGHLIYGSVA